MNDRAKGGQRTSSAPDFFETDVAENLMDAAYIPLEVAEFLRQERRIIELLEDSFDLLVEVGCMDGRYLDWAIGRRKRYLGIDIISRHIQAGRRRVAERGESPERYRFVRGDAEEVAALVEPERFGVSRERCRVLFPFNIFGAVTSAGRVLASLRQGRLPFLISSYQTTEYATACRLRYYSNCGCRGIRILRDDKGVCFTTENGLQTTAYHPQYLQRLCGDYGLAVTPVAWGDINMVYLTGEAPDGRLLESLARPETPRPES
jgi:hypothetical protein